MPRYPVLPLLLAISTGILPTVRPHTVLRYLLLYRVLTHFISLLDQRQRFARFRRPNLVHLSGRLQIAASVEQPVSRIRLQVLFKFQQRRVGMNRRRHVPQERLHRVPRESGSRWVCCTRFGRTKLGHTRGCSDADDRVGER